MRSPIGVKLFTMVNTGPSFIMPVQNFWEHTPKKISRAKNMQNLARFRTTSKFGGEYLRKVKRYSKSVSYFLASGSSRVRQNKFGEGGSSELGDLDVELYPPKTHISEDIFQPLRNVAPSNFYTR